MNLGNPEPLLFQVADEHNGQRLDKFLSSCLIDQSRSRIQDWIDKGAVRKNNQAILNSNYKVKKDDIFSVVPPPIIDAVPQPQKINLNIVYEDNDLLIIDKAAGMVVHPAPGNYDNTLVNALLEYCGDSLSGIGGVKRPGIVHRLDKDTSGLMVVAKNDQAHHSLSKQFSVDPSTNERSLKRIYWALVWGQPNPSKGCIHNNIGRHKTNRQKMAVVKGAHGKEAITFYNTLQTWNLSSNTDQKISLIEFNLGTGRTHQIRVHSHFIGHPLIGDQIYGRKNMSSVKYISDEILTFPRQALHAKYLQFIHPKTNEILEFASKLPKDIQLLLKTLEDLKT